MTHLRNTIDKAGLNNNPAYAEPWQVSVEGEERLAT